jgi:DNA-binding MarR family transcriptional regulator
MDYKNDTDVINLLYKIFILLKHGMEKHLEKEGVGHSYGIILKTISEYRKIRITELSDRLGMSNSTLSGIIEKLNSLGIVKRERSIEDRRVVYVSMTPEFEKNHGNFHERINTYIKDIIKKISPEEQRKLIEGLKILEKLLEDSTNINDPVKIEK